jgi:hypothetical protein
MANHTVTTSPGRPQDFGALYEFDEVFRKEIIVLNQRRAGQRTVAFPIVVCGGPAPGEFSVQFGAEARHGAATPDAQGREQRGAFELEIEAAAADSTGQPVLTPPEAANVVGLALSGGGIRSAAFCLGALQALESTKVLQHVDYLSTVSGGGYIGCSLTACLEQSGHRGWEFPFTSGLKEDEPPALQHIRDYSNYLFPHGAIDFLYNASIYARGLVVNAVLVTPFLLVGAILTLLAYSYCALEGPTAFVISILNPFHLSHFFVTVDLLLLVVLVSIVWGIVQSTPSRKAQPEMPGLWTHWVGWIVIFLFIALFCEAQPFVLDAMLQPESGNTQDAGITTRLVATLSSSINAIVALLTPVAAAIAFLANKVGEYVKSSIESPQRNAQIKGYAVKAAIMLAGLVVPLLLWVIYLDITYSGLCADDPGYVCSPPPWLKSIESSALFSWTRQPALWLYGSVAFCLFLITLLMQPNANSLHPLYRDRLGRAFLFRLQQQLSWWDKLKRWRPRLSDITGLYGPYHLINVALNLEDSKVANRRGRNADFFIFSSRFVGSKSTDYVATADVEDVAVGLDLATAMAASGAAVSSNMGAQNIKPLTATLALLNIRLGYWLRNPRKLAAAKPGAMSGFRRHNNILANYYFLAEMFGLLNEKRKSVYLTDGGHIENLGIYELLRRRCRVIIAVDAEADPQMAFGSFNMLERYALIDMGIRIDLPWQKIADESLTTGKLIDDTGNAPKHHGPHCAIGQISYPNNRKGILVYIKASLTGDENDYIFDYKKRYSAFPHETTLDQMFTEEQFEAYRALGFHAAYEFFAGNDNFAQLDPDEDVDATAQVVFLNRLFGLDRARPRPR